MITDRFVLRFEEVKISARVMDRGRVRLIDLELKPYGYRSYVEPLWVAGEMKMLWGSVRGLKKREPVKCEVRDEGSFWVGGFQAGKVVDEDELEAGLEYETPSPRLQEAASLTVIVSGFRRILKGAPVGAKQVGFDVDGAGGHLLFMNEKPSILDLQQDWRVSSRGRKRALYDLEMFTPLMVLDLSETADIVISEQDPATIKYSEPEYELKFYVAPVASTERRDLIGEALAVPKPLRTEILTLSGKKGVKSLVGTLRAIGYLTEEATITIRDQLLIHWRGVSLGVFRISMGILDRWSPPAEPISGDFKVSELGKLLKDVETLKLYEDVSEGKRRLVFVGEGPMIAPREITCYEPIGEVKVPELGKFIGVGVFTGPTDLIHRTIEDAQVAEDYYLIWYTTPHELVAFGRNAVYYVAEFEADDFMIVSEEGIVPIKSGYFKTLIGFLGNVPSPISTIGYGAERDTDIYLTADTDVGELATVLPQEFPEAHKLVEEYRRAKERPPAPPEVKPLPEVAPPMLLPPVVEVPPPLPEVILEVIPLEEIPPGILYAARLKFYLENPGHYETPTPEQLQPYLR